MIAYNQLNKVQNDVDNSRSNEIDSTVKTMPEDMPNDFGFSIQFGIVRNNEINTFEHTVTKDLIVDGIIKADVTLTNEEMEEIYYKMKEINIVKTKKFTPEEVNGTICTKKTFEEDEWKININGETITHFVSSTYCEPTNDAKQLIELRNYVFSIIKSKGEYIELPKSKGGYE